MKALIVDDHILFRAGLRMLIQGIQSGLLVFEASLIDEALHLAVRHADLRLCFMDIHLADKNGLDAIGQIKLAAPDLAVIVVSAEDNYQAVINSLDAGAMAYIPKRSSPVELSHALAKVLRGEVYLPPDIVASQPCAQAALPELSKRQWDVFRCLMRGLPNKLICRELDLSDNTVKSHLHAIYRAFNVNTRTRLLLAAAKMPAGSVGSTTLSALQ